MTKINKKSKKQNTKVKKSPTKEKKVVKAKGQALAKVDKIIKKTGNEIKQQSALKKNKLNKVTKSKLNTSSKNILKQEKWVEHFRSYLKNVENDDPTLQPYFDVFSKVDSIPRREAKFKNFLTGSIKITKTGAIEQIWEKVKGAFSIENQAKEVENKNNTKDKNDETEENVGEESPAKKKKVQRKKNKKSVN